MDESTLEPQGDGPSARAPHEERGEYPVSLDVTPPARWDRMQVAVRLVVLLVAGYVSSKLGGIFAILYLALPVAAAIVISRRGGEGYLQEPAARLSRWLHWWNAIVAYLALLTDRFPTSTEDLVVVRFEVARGGTPTVGGALIRLLTSLPELIVLAVLAWVGMFVWLIAAVVVLATELVPDFAWRYLRLVVRLQARLLAYHTSLTDRYPPLAERRELPST